MLILYALTKIVEEEADLFWLYIGGGCLVVIILIVIVLIYCRVKGEKQIQAEVIESREKGIVQTWGVKINHDLVKYEDLKPSHVSRNKAGTDSSDRSNAHMNTNDLSHLQASFNV